jgi:hypothetical protein
VRVIQKHKLPASIRHLVPAGFVLSLALLPVTALVVPVLWWVWLALVAAYLFCSVCAAVKAAGGWGWDVLWLMPLVFASYHFGYGTGFMVGIRDFVITRRGARSFSRQITRTT